MYNSVFFMFSVFYMLLRPPLGANPQSILGELYSATLVFRAQKP